MLSSMKKYMIIALAGIFAWTGCQVAEEDFAPEQPEEVQETVSTWTLTVPAERGIGPETKGMAIGDGTEATTTELKSIWKANEFVKVYKDGSCIGTLMATPNGVDPHKATLSGAITTSGITQGVTRLTLLTPRESWDYNDQVGKLLITDDATNSIEKKYHYTMAADVLVTGVSGLYITTETATFRNQQSIYRLSFKYSGSGISTKSVTISGASGHLVQSQVLGGATTEGDISVTLGSATADPFFVAIRNGDVSNDEVFTFTVVDPDGVTYRGTKTIPAAYKPNGTFVSAKNTTLTERLALAQSNTEVVTVL